MGFFDRLSRLIRSNLNDLIGKAEDPSKILEQSMADMQDDLVKLRQAVGLAIASQKRMENQSSQASQQTQIWYERAQLALSKGEESLAKEALVRRKTLKESSITLENQIKGQSTHVEKLKRSLITLENKIAEAKTKKDMLKARAQAAQAQQQLENVVGGMNSNSAMAAFQRMEDKVESLEASSQAAAELAGVDLENQFKVLENSDDIEAELESIRANLKVSANKAALPEGTDDTNEMKSKTNDEIEIVNVTEIEDELEQLKKDIGRN